MEKRQSLQLKVLGKLNSHKEKNETRQLCYTIHKLIKNLNVKLETIKLLEENIGSILFDIGLSNLSGYTSSDKKSKAKINK